MNSKMVKFEMAIDKVLHSVEPSIRWKTRVNILGQDPDSSEILLLQEEIRCCSIVRKLLSGLTESGIKSEKNVYDKWQGAHWILASLADIGYPQNDPALFPVKEQVLEYWLDKRFYNEFNAESPKEAYAKSGVPVMQGRHRTCASQQGYALFSLLRLGLADERVHALAERLLHWQWPDGGWNCDKNPSATNATFVHTLWSLRGLSLYYLIYKDEKIGEAVNRAAEVLLKRQLFIRSTTNQVINKELMFLHYPLYWHYDILGSLKVMAEAGFIHDSRCSLALDLLESKMFETGGWPCEKSYYKVSDELKLGNDYVNWGGTSKTRVNEWITVDALFILKKAGRLNS